MTRLISQSVFAPHCQQLLVEQSKNLHSTIADLVDHTSPWAMSALGQKRTSRPAISTSASPPKADIGGRELDVRFVPKADISLVWNP
jgi:hypothetical protein